MPPAAKAEFLLSNEKVRDWHLLEAERLWLHIVITSSPSWASKENTITRLNSICVPCARVFYDALIAENVLDVRWHSVSNETVSNVEQLMLLTVVGNPPDTNV